MNRVWDVVPTQQPTDSIGVRFYYQPTEYQSVNASVGNPMVSETDMVFYKLLGAQPFPWSNQAALAPTDVKIYLHGTAPSLDRWHHNTTLDNKPYAEYYVSSFSGGGGGGGTSAILPIVFVAAEAFRQHEQVYLNWQVAHAVNVAAYAVESLQTNGTWQELGQVSASESHSYAYTHQPVADAQTHYYRIRAIDFDGAETLSPVITLMQSSPAAFALTVFPNPAENWLVASIEGEIPPAAEVVLYDATGHETLRQPLVAARTTLDLTQLAAGLYACRVTADGLILSTTRVIKN